MEPSVPRLHRLQSAIEPALFVFSLTVLLWQWQQWLLFPTDTDFPYRLYAPLLITASVVQWALWRRIVPKRLPHMITLRKAWRRAWFALTVAAIVAITLLYARAAARVAKIGARTDTRIDCSPAILDATVAMEDGNFYRHNGFDFAALHRALRVDMHMGRIRQGGSTITQQLAKNLFLSNDRTLWRKLDEAFYTVALERRFSKYRILQLYLGAIDYGQGQRGLPNAAYFYFHKAPDRLTLAESAVLVGMVSYAPRQWPSRARLERGRQTALDRIAYWFPGRYSPEEIDAARQISLEPLLPDLPRSASLVRRRPE